MTSEAPVFAALFERAQRVIPSGVNSPVRAFRAVGGTPRFMVSRSYQKMTDADGVDYVDLVSWWGPMILGHSHPAIVEAAQRAAASRVVIRHADPRARSSWPRRSSAGSTPGRRGAAGQLRHRGDDVGAPAGSRCHRPAPGDQVRRLLPRPRGRAARRGRFRHSDVRAAGHTGRHRGADRRNGGAALQRPGRGARRASPSPASHRLRHHRGGRGQHGGHRADREASTRGCARSRRSTARCWSWTR